MFLIFAVDNYIMFTLTKRKNHYLTALQNPQNISMFPSYIFVMLFSNKAIPYPATFINHGLSKSYFYLNIIGIPITNIINIGYKKN